MTFLAGEDATSKRMEDELGVGRRKVSDQSVTSSTTLVNDTVITWPVDAFGQYIFDLYLAYTGSTTGNLSIGFGVPTGATMSWCADGLDTGLAYKNVANLTAVSVSAYGCASISAARTVHVSGFLSVDVTAGTFVLKWAQNTSNATSTVMRAGTMGLLTRV